EFYGVTQEDIEHAALYEVLTGVTKVATVGKPVSKQMKPKVKPVDETPELMPEPEPIEKPREKES
ncbi:MAG TPA: hypothetical protein VK927_05570, partial [Adhaeribacter sp.]|nr:hypothetical protein [Adhaeribacter sp.]